MTLLTCIEHAPRAGEAKVAGTAVISEIVEFHATESAFLWTLRERLATAAHITLQRLGAFDERLEAHIDGLRVAGDAGQCIARAQLFDESGSGAFVAAVLAIESREVEVIHSLFALALATPAAQAPLVSAFGWSSARSLQGIVKELLGSVDAFRRYVGVACCAMHRVDPAIVAAHRLQDPDPIVRARAFRAAGELGLRELVSSCAAVSCADDDPEVRFWAAWSAALLGDRHVSLDVLTERGLSPEAHRARSLRLAIQAMSPSAAHQTLQRLAEDPESLRWLIQGSGFAGNPAYVPWLMKHMDHRQTARLAGNAFTLITGADLDLQALNGPAPDGFEAGPSDDPDDPNVEMDPDEGLPWPDQAKVQAWWDGNAHRFQKGTRYFIGAPVTRAHCIHVLKHGYQRQRILAAQYLCLLEPGTPLFNTSAPAWRQEKLLDQMV